MNRRDLLNIGAGALALGALPVHRQEADEEASSRTGVQNMHLSLAAYSMRDALRSGEMNLFEFINWCAELGVPGAELTSYYFEDGFDGEYLLELRRHAFRRGVTVSGTAIRNNFCLPPGDELDREISHVRNWIGYAAELFAPHIRIFAGNLSEGVDRKTGIRWVADAIRSVLPDAADRGITLGLENHGGITARAADHLAICAAVGEHPWFGVNLDTGNYQTNAYEELALAAPLAVNVQVKVEIRDSSGELVPTDLTRIRGILEAVDYRGWVVLEYESSEDPYTAIPRHLSEMRHVFE